MHSAIFLLTLESDLVFSARAATQGGHDGLDYIPGAALLGWAAGKLYGASDIDSYTVFHSGKVRFGNGLPITGDGKVGFPVPQLLTERKGKRDGIAKGQNGAPDRLSPEHLRIAPHRFGDGNDSEQAEPLKRCYVTSCGEVITPKADYRLKTAIENGRAAESQLFGYRHIAAGTRYVASLEADRDVPQGTFDQLAGMFAGRSLIIGRSRHAEYGGEIRCERIEPVVEVWPSRSGVQMGDEVTVWLLSDLALDDEQGAPTFAPPSTTFSLPLADIRHDRSAVSIRRYAPFNGYLRRPDMERAVITAGSVLRYACKATSHDCSAGFGLHREQGLGRVWINPPLLAGEGPSPTLCAPREVPRIISRRPIQRPEPDDYAADLLAWARAGTEHQQKQQQRDDTFAHHAKELDKLYATSRSRGGDKFAGPRNAQWGRIIGLSRNANIDMKQLRRALVDDGSKAKGEMQPICTGEDWNKEGVAEGGKLQSFAGWMRSVTDKARWPDDTDPQPLQAILGRLAEYAIERFAKER